MRKYSDEFKKDVLFDINSGLHKNRVSINYNMPMSTLNQWIREDKEKPLKVEKEFLKRSCGRADRFNDGKPQWSLVDFEALEPLVSVLEYGAKKYSRDNWKKGLPINETIESLLRHTFALLRGEDIDSESGCKHVGHIQANAMFIAHMQYDDFLG